LILKRLLQDRARQHGKKATLVDVTIGYELRCAMPTPFDVAYTHQLGWGATCALLSPELETASQGGVMVLVRGSRVESVPLRDLLDPRTGKMTVRRVSVDTDSYRAALAGMTRLTSDDLVEPRVVALAAAANLSVETFVELYGPAARIGMP
jgi:6-phosphofructokinase 1